LDLEVVCLNIGATLPLDLYMQCDYNYQSLTSLKLTTSRIFHTCGTHDEDVIHCLRACAPS